MSPEDADGCMCTFQRGCGGTGALYCSPPCGGDQCVCLCGGEQECAGCIDCEPDRYAGDDEDDDSGEDYE